jgi:hypothetical protein
MIMIDHPLTFLLHERFAAPVVKFLAVAHAAANGECERQDCFVCTRAWSPTRTIAAIGVAEIVNRPQQRRHDHALLFVSPARARA